MSADPLESVDILRPIVFLDALIRLQTMLGRQVKVELNDYGCFFGCGFEGRLEKVETMPSGKSAISAFVGKGGGFFLDPDDCQAYVVDSGRDGPTWLEFHRPVGPVVAIQAVDRPSVEVRDAIEK